MEETEERTSRASKHHIIITRCNKFGAILGSFDDGKGAATPKPPLSASWHVSRASELLVCIFTSMKLSLMDNDARRVILK